MEDIVIFSDKNHGFRFGKIVKQTMSRVHLTEILPHIIEHKDLSDKDSDMINQLVIIKTNDLINIGYKICDEKYVRKKENIIHLTANMTVIFDDTFDKKSSKLVNQTLNIFDHEEDEMA